MTILSARESEQLIEPAQQVGGTDSVSEESVQKLRR